MIRNLTSIDNNLFVVLVLSLFFSALVYTSIIDLYLKKIPNILTIIIAVTGISYNYTLSGNAGLLICLYGLMTGFFVTLFFFQFAGLGAGDVKLFSAIGALVGYQLILLIIAYSYVISAFLGIVYFKLWLPLQQSKIPPSSASNQKTWLSKRIPMAPGICIATFYVVLSQIIE